MARTRRPSPQMLSLMEALAARAPEWSHGYDLMKATGLRSGTLYPLLMRMTDQGLVDAKWQEPVSPGRPPRHAYRLTVAGLRRASEVRDDGRSPSGVPFPA